MGICRTGLLQRSLANDCMRKFTAKGSQGVILPYRVLNVLTSRAYLYILL